MALLKHLTVLPLFIDCLRKIMLAKRLIPCLDIENGRVVKGVNFIDIKDAGDPVEVAKRYNDQGADEITFFGYYRKRRWARYYL